MSAGVHSSMWKAVVLVGVAMVRGCGGVVGVRWRLDLDRVEVGLVQVVKGFKEWIMGIYL